MLDWCVISGIRWWQARVGDRKKWGNGSKGATRQQTARLREDLVIVYLESALEASPIKEKGLSYAILTTPAMLTTAEYIA